METLRPLVLLFLLMVTESLTQEQQQVLILQADVPDNREVIRDRRSPQFEGLFGYGGGRRGYHQHGYAGSHIKKHTTTYGIGPFYASYSTSHANSHAGHGHGPHYGHGYRPYKPYNHGYHGGYNGGYHGGYNGGYHGGYNGGYHGGYNGYHGGGGGGGLFTSFLDF